MDKRTKISDAEWEVMAVVWDREPVTAVEVLSGLPHEDWKQKTVNTFLARLEQKGIVRSERVGRANVYASVLTEKECRREEGMHFLTKVFRGKVTPMMAHFLEQEELSDDEITKLEQLLKKKRKS